VTDRFLNVSRYVNSF